jgi:hypothetical protein
MGAYFTEFPFEEVRNPQGDYFLTAEDALAVTRCQPNQIWSVTISESENPNIRDIFTYGPADYRRLGYHAGYVVTVEKHDNNTLYVENIMEEWLDG